MATTELSLVDLLQIAADIDVVDVGANPIDGERPYRPLMSNGIARVVGFEPNEEALDRLLQQRGPHETYLPHAIGDGKRHTLHICRAEGMNSLLRPNDELLKLFHGFPQWGEIVRTREIDTVRLDDVPQIQDVDLLKIDIQGAELMVFQHAPKVLSRCVVVHTEVEFLPLYVDQPLFSDVERFLRAQGFVLHKFDDMVSRAIAPMLIGGDVFKGLGQVVWSDAIFVRDFTRLGAMESDKLLKMSIILHDMYGSHDLVLLLLREHDRRLNTAYADTYLEALN